MKKLFVPKVHLTRVVNTTFKGKQGSLGNDSVRKPYVTHWIRTAEITQMET